LSITITGSETVAFSGSDKKISKEKNVRDIDGNIYHTVKIGKQVWLVENLSVTHYRDGTPILNVQDDNDWTALTEGAYCLEKENPSTYKKTYGALYNYNAVEDERGLCPEGWNVPSEKEWQELIDHLGGDGVAGSKMKDTNSNLWKLPNLTASNESGFSGLPAGGRGRRGSPEVIGSYATWWSSTSYDTNYAWHWGLYPDKNGIRFNPGHKASGFSVRCIKDQ
jgi:uncharacterized protein (TIGR02145 family)